MALQPRFRSLTSELAGKSEIFSRNFDGTAHLNTTSLGVDGASMEVSWQRRWMVSVNGWAGWKLKADKGVTIKVTEKEALSSSWRGTW